MSDAPTTEELIAGLMKLGQMDMAFDRSLCEAAASRFRALEDFKSYVHQRLDEAGIEKRPDGPHSAAGCRVGDRLDIALAIREAAAVGAREMINAALIVHTLTARLERLEGASFQHRVQPWMMECFGPEIAADKLERNDRFIEEALELTQASGYTVERAHALVEYVFNRDQGEINQEVGGVMVTLAAHCLAHGVDMHTAGETELARIWTKVDQIRAKQAGKPKGSALPVAALSPEPPVKP